MVFSFDRALRPRSDFKAYIAGIKEVKKIDELTVDVITDGPNPILPELTDQHPDHVQGVVGEAQRAPSRRDFKDKEETYAVRNAMGTGPYMVKQRDPDVRTVLAKNPTYWGAKDFPQHPDELVYTPIKEPRRGWRR